MKHFNINISQIMRNVFNLKSESSNEVIDAIQPVVEVGRRHINIIRNATATNSTSASIYTTPADKDFYLTSASLSVIKDVTAVSVRSDIQAFGADDGITRQILTISGITLTPQSETISISLPFPFLVKRNTSITTNNTSATANIVQSATITGYVLD
jgi:hypothetical protein